MPLRHNRGRLNPNVPSMYRNTRPQNQRPRSQNPMRRTGGQSPLNRTPGFQNSQISSPYSNNYIAPGVSYLNLITFSQIFINLEISEDKILH